uniref:site-specific DNA-methyltransferase (adenine-specific) n=2 Tax=Spiroplasma citri TaxID=2133 RepID=Q14NR6_SPICI|nr:hypothetical dna methyltransferase n-terminal and c-terminal truncated protein [Spiroplasma citri]
MNLSKLLNNNVEIINDDFETVCEYAQKGDFIFFDPPYDLLKKILLIVILKINLVKKDKND